MAEAELKNHTKEAPLKNKKKVLHIGCGTGKIHESFNKNDWQEVRVDIDPGVKPDIVANMLDLHMIDDNDFDAVFSSHNLEHLFAHEVVKALREFYRTLKEGGFVAIMVPDLQKVAEEVARGRMEKPLYTSPAGPISAVDIFYGLRSSIAQGQIYMAHKTGFTAVTLSNRLIEAGYANIRVTRSGYNLWAQAYKLANFDREKNMPKVIEPNYTKIMEVRDTINKEPEIWTPLNLKKK